MVDQPRPSGRLALTAVCFPEDGARLFLAHDISIGVVAGNFWRNASGYDSMPWRGFDPSRIIGIIYAKINSELNSDEGDFCPQIVSRWRNPLV